MFSFHCWSQSCLSVAYLKAFCLFFWQILRFSHGFCFLSVLMCGFLFIYMLGVCRTFWIWELISFFSLGKLSTPPPLFFAGFDSVLFFPFLLWSNCMSVWITFLTLFYFFLFCFFYLSFFLLYLEFTFLTRLPISS